MSWRRQVYTLKVIVEALSERERIITLSTLMLLIVMLWMFLIYSPQRAAISATKLQTSTVTSESKTLSQKIMMIESIAKSATTEKLMARFEAIKSEMLEIEDQLSHHQQRFISEKDLYKLLHDMLKDTHDIQIDNFQSDSNTTAPAQASLPSAAENTAEKSKEGAEVQPALLSSHYILVLKGRYLPIMAYLKNLEKLPWQLYWDKFSYDVTQHPEAIATIHFYTLRPNPKDL